MLREARRCSRRLRDVHDKLLFSVNESDILQHALHSTCVAPCLALTIRLQKESDFFFHHRCRLLATVPEAGLGTEPNAWRGCFVRWIARIADGARGACTRWHERACAIVQTGLYRIQTLKVRAQHSIVLLILWIVAPRQAIELACFPNQLVQVPRASCEALRVHNLIILARRCASRKGMKGGMVSCFASTQRRFSRSGYGRAEGH